MVIKIEFTPLPDCNIVLPFLKGFKKLKTVQISNKDKQVNNLTIELGHLYWVESLYIWEKLYHIKYIMAP